MDLQRHQDSSLPRHELAAQVCSQPTDKFLLLTVVRYNTEFYETVPPKIAAGDIKYKEHSARGLESAGQVIYDVQTGGNFGKAVVILADS